jgi:hypothetical protein
MEIRIQMKGYIYSICIGRKTNWFTQLYFISVLKEYRDDKMNLEYVEMVFHS